MSLSLAQYSEQDEAAREVLADLTLSSTTAAARLTAAGWPVSAPTVRQYRREKRALTLRGPNPVAFTTGDRAALHSKLDELLSQADPAGVSKLTAKTWDTTIKNDLGEAETVRNYGITLESAHWEPSWPVVAPAAPVREPYPRG